MSSHGVSRLDHWLVLFSKFIDACLVVGVLAAAVWLSEHQWATQYSLAASLAVIAFVLFAELSGLYRPWRGETVGRQFFQILSVWAATSLVLLLLVYAFNVAEPFSRQAVGLWFVATPITLSGWRPIARKVLHRFRGGACLPRNAFVWGSGDVATKLAQTIVKSPWLGLQLSGCYIEGRPHCANGSLPSEVRAVCAEPDTDALDRLECQARQGEFDILYVALPSSARDRIGELIDRLSDTTVSVYVVPDYFTTTLFNSRMTNLNGVPLISVYETPFWGIDGWLKRFEDTALAALFLFVSAVPMILIAGAVRLSSPGPILFKQRRYGIGGKEITVWKFRTMTVCEDGAALVQAKKNDPRVTRVGAFLRRNSLDELPQFFNVLRGEMSIVGPRPHAVAHNEFYREKVKGYMLRHKIRPGVTGWAQINGWRGETDSLEKMQRRVEHDLWYVDNWSLWLDLKIITLTVVRGFNGTHAY
jgi:putative colanic acid biosynthesis UDP-glucose lipid carrier transferase